MGFAEEDLPTGCVLGKLTNPNMPTVAGHLIYDIHEGRFEGTQCLIHLLKDHGTTIGVIVSMLWVDKENTQVYPVGRYYWRYGDEWYLINYAGFLQEIWKYLDGFMGS